MEQFPVLCVPVLYPQPSLLDVVKMETGRLAKHTFGAPTDPVFYVVRTPQRPSVDPAALEDPPR